MQQLPSEAPVHGARRRLTMKTIFVSLRSICAAFLVLASLGSTTNANATAMPSGVDALFDFSANCKDCAQKASLASYPVTGLLALKNFVAGANLDFNNNFVSFTYGGSNLVPQFTITADDFMYPELSGILDDDGSVSELFILSNFDVPGCDSACFLSVGADGGWNLEVDDFGDLASFTRTSGVGMPEPATLLLFGLGLIGVGCQKRKQVKAT
jgi:hypothetical protein